MENLINENMAREAKRANSFSDYMEGSATDSYSGMLKEFDDAIEKLKERAKFAGEERDEKLELVDYYCTKYKMKLASAINRENSIRARVPSIMICGAGNFPVRKKEKQNAAMQRFWEESGELFEPTNNYYYNKIAGILMNTTIYSGDALAIEKLENKLADAQEAHEEMKAANAHYRKNNTMKGYLNLTDEAADKWDKAILNGYSFQQMPYASYELTNSNGRMKQIRDRIALLKREKEAGNKEYDCEDLGFTVKEDKDIMRLQLRFDGKPDDNTRKTLKSNGFVWAPSQGAWQRQLTNNARWALKYVIKELQNQEV